jgi:hypothetical protein
MKLNFSIPFLNLDGTPYQEGGETILLSKILKSALSYMTEGIEPLKGLDWMLKLEKAEELDLDPVDRDKLKKLISDGFKGMTLVARGRLLEVFEAKPAAETV